VPAEGESTASVQVATRYDKLAENFLAMVHLASMRLWLRVHESTAYISAKFILN
jgi:hypothetical protein